jgi:polyhydroxyalkanoate synthesis regulator phasin
MAPDRSRFGPPHLAQSPEFDRIETGATGTHPTPLKLRITVMDNSSWLTQLLMIGVGTTSLAAEKFREVSDEWVREGKLNPEQAAGFVNDMMKQMQANQGDLEANFQRQVRNIMQDVGVARQTEVDELRGRIDRLERQVRDLENKTWR